MEIKDLNDNVVGVGDRIAAAFRIGNAAVLRVGTVLGFGERGNNVTIRTHWDTSSSWYGARDVDIEGAIDASLFRFIKIADAKDSK